MKVSLTRYRIRFSDIPGVNTKNHRETDPEKSLWRILNQDQTCILLKEALEKTQLSFSNANLLLYQSPVRERGS
jgi:hypothetical protein